MQVCVKIIRWKCSLETPHGSAGEDCVEAQSVIPLFCNVPTSQHSAYFPPAFFARMKNRSGTPATVFYALALLISGPFFYWRDVLHWEGFAGPNVLKTASYMWGPGIAGLLCYALYRRKFKKRVTLWGFSAPKSLLVWLGPALLLAALGLRGPSGEADHLTPLMLIPLGFLTIWGEEVGWRWFLQDYLAPIHPLRKYILIGVMWELWHLRFLTKLGQPITSILLTSLVVLVITVLVSIIIGYATDRTRSLMVAVALHEWVDMCLEFPQPNVYICAAVMVALAAVACFGSNNQARAIFSSGSEGRLVGK